MHADAFVGIKALATPAPTRQHPCMVSPPCALVRRCAELRRKPHRGSSAAGLGSACGASRGFHCETRRNASASAATTSAALARERARGRRTAATSSCAACAAPCPCRVPPQQPPHAATETIAPKEHAGAVTASTRRRDDGQSACTAVPEHRPVSLQLAPRHPALLAAPPFAQPWARPFSRNLALAEMPHWPANWLDGSPLCHGGRAHLPIATLPSRGTRRPL
jgi:hypothetical protein